jgi:hypothetical protein
MWSVSQKFAAQAERVSSPCWLGFERPVLPHVDRVDVFQTVLMQTAYGRLEPRIEHDRTVGAKEIADAVAPAVRLLLLARGDEIHRPREVDARAAEVIRVAHERSRELLFR